MTENSQHGTTKKVLVTELTTSKAEGRLLDGGDHKDTYNHKLLQEIAKKQQEVEAAKKLQKIKDAKKWIGIEKMKQTKLKKKQEAEAKAKAVATASAPDKWLADSAAVGPSAVGGPAVSASASSSTDAGSGLLVAGI